MSLNPIADMSGFEARLKAYIKVQKSSQNIARTLAHFAITHFEAHGDLGPAQRFHDAMAKNYSRQPAFVKWMAAHSPIMMEKSKFLKDKGGNAKEFDIVGALKVDFWDFAPEAPIVDFTWHDLHQALLATVTKFESKKYHTEDQSTLDMIERYKMQFDPETTPVSVAA